MKRTEVAMLISRRAALGGIAAAAAWLQGCGGGGGGSSVAGISSGGTGSFTTGTVSGLGSIIVRGVRYDDSRAAVSRSDDGVVGSLRPGMVVAIVATPVVAAQAGATMATATAVRIGYASEWAGPIDAVDAAAGTITVLGQTVEVPSATVIEGVATQLSALAAGQFVEVHGYLDLATARLLATRIEVTTVAAPALRLSGQVASLDSAARTFRIGTTLISYGAGLELPTGFGNGQLVRVTLGDAQVAGAWPAQRIRVRQAALEDVQTGDVGAVEGTLTAFTSPASFSVDGVAVDASGVPATAGLGVGVLVQVQGSMRNGVLVARQVEVKPRSVLDTGAFRFIGQVSELDVLTRTFTLQGESFTYGLSAVIAVPLWLTGATPLVEVSAVRAGGQWQATEIKEAP